MLSREKFRDFVRIVATSFEDQVLNKVGKLSISDSDIDPLWSSIEGIWTEHRGVTLSKLLWCKTVFEWKLEDVRNVY